MYISTLAIDGLQHAPAEPLEGLERLVRLPRGPQGVAVADALTLWASALTGEVGEAALHLGLARDAEDLEVIEESAEVVQVGWRHADAARMLFTDEGSCTVDVKIQPDPPLFGRLRALAVKEPRLVEALADSPELQVKVGWLLTRDFSVAAPSVLGFRVGSVRFNTSAERPPWLPAFLDELGQKVLRSEVVAVPALGEAIHQDLLSADPSERARVAELQAALAAPPFELGRLELARIGGRMEPVFGPGLLRSRSFSGAAERAVSLAASVLLGRPDVLVVEAPGALQADPEAVVAWLEARTRGDDASLEQVFVVDAGAP